MTLEQATINQLSELQSVCVASYSQIYAEHWTGNGLDLYLEQEFGTDRLTSDLNDINCQYFFIKKEAENIGFIKIDNTSSSELSELDNSELAKIYIQTNYSGMGIGKMAMTEIIQQVKQKGKKLFFLCVIDTNTNAIAFYEKLGFKFHSKTRLEIPLFREELKGMHRMCLKL